MSQNLAAPEVGDAFTPHHSETQVGSGIETDCEPKDVSNADSFVRSRYRDQLVSLCHDSFFDH